MDTVKERNVYLVFCGICMNDFIKITVNFHACAMLAIACYFLIRTFLLILI